MCSKLELKQDSAANKIDMYQPLDLKNGYACKCPICEGKLKVPYDFYPVEEDTNQLESLDLFVTCKTCFGTGFIVIR